MYDKPNVNQKNSFHHFPSQHFYFSFRQFETWEEDRGGKEKREKICWDSIPRRWRIYVAPEAANWTVSGDKKCILIFFFGSRVIEKHKKGRKVYRDIQTDLSTVGLWLTAVKVKFQNSQHDKYAGMQNVAPNI